MLYVIKKDGTREEFNPQKIVAAVNNPQSVFFILFQTRRRILSAVLPRSMRIPLERMRSRSRRCTTS